MLLLISLPVCGLGPGQQHQPPAGPVRHVAVPLRPRDHLGESLQIVWDDYWQEVSAYPADTTLALPYYTPLLKWSATHLPDFFRV